MLVCPTGCLSRLPDCLKQSGFPTVECPTVSPTLFGGQSVGIPQGLSRIPLAGGRYARRRKCHLRQGDTYSRCQMSPPRIYLQAVQGPFCECVIDLGCSCSLRFTFFEIFGVRSGSRTLTERFGSICCVCMCFRELQGRSGCRNRCFFVKSPKQVITFFEAYANSQVILKMSDVPP